MKITKFFYEYHEIHFYQPQNLMNVKKKSYIQKTRNKDYDLLRNTKKNPKDNKIESLVCKM